MKKIIFCLGIVAMSMSSCSSDSDSSTETGGELVKTIVYNSITDSYTETVNFTYNGNKLVKGVYNDGTQDIYTYTGDQITKIQMMDGADVLVTETFTYDGSGRLTQYVFEEDDYVEEAAFVYNPDGTATMTQGVGSPASTLHFQNGELVKIVHAGGQTYNYTYDGKNSPFKNVTGYGKIAHVAHGDHEFFGAMQNISTIHETMEDVDYMTNTMTYNADDYPTSATSNAIFESDPYTATMQYTYF